MAQDIDDTARLVDATVGDSELREFVTVHDSTVGDGCSLYERTSVKKSTIDDDVDVNAGSYVENAAVGPGVQIGPNCAVVGVTHELTADGMTFRDDIFSRCILHAGVFLGAGAVVGPGVEVGEDAVIGAGATVTDDVDDGQVVVGSPPHQRRVPLETWLER